MNIQESSKKLLLTFYWLQRQHGYISDDVLEVSRIDNVWSLKTSNEDFKSLLYKTTDQSIVTIKNSIDFLREESLIDFNGSSRNITGELDIFDLHVTSEGIKLIEGIEKAGPTKVTFQNTFNVKLADNIDVESLVKNELGSIFSLLG